MKHIKGIILAVVFGALGGFFGAFFASIGVGMGLSLMLLPSSVITPVSALAGLIVGVFGLLVGIRAGWDSGLGKDND